MWSSSSSSSCDHHHHHHHHHCHHQRDYHHNHHLEIPRNTLPKRFLTAWSQSNFRLTLSLNLNFNNTKILRHHVRRLNFGVNMGGKNIPFFCPGQCIILYKFKQKLTHSKKTEFHTKFVDICSYQRRTPLSL